MKPFSNDKILFSLLDRYGLLLNEKEELLSIIGFIYNHDEFQRRMTDEFMGSSKSSGPSII